MTGTVETDGAFNELAWVSITKKSGSAIEFSGKILAFTPGIGRKGISQRTLINGGRDVAHTPEELQSVTIELHPLDANYNNGSDVIQLFEGDDADTSGQIDVQPSWTRNLYRVVMVWTQEALSTAAGTTTAGYAARRIVMKDLRCVAYTVEKFDSANPLKITATFEGPVFDRSRNKLRTTSTVTESGSGFNAVGSYT